MGRPPGWPARRPRPHLGAGQGTLGVYRRLADCVGLPRAAATGGGAAPATAGRCRGAPAAADAAGRPVDAVLRGRVTDARTLVTVISSGRRVVVARPRADDRDVLSVDVAAALARARGEGAD